MAGTTNKYEGLADCSCYMIRRSARKITQFYEQKLRIAGIKPTQFTILATLANAGSITITDLADRLTLERTSLTRNLNVLERNGWVAIEAGEKDSRQRFVSLTKDGFSRLDLAIPHWQEAQAALNKEIGGNTMNALRDTLKNITKGLER